MTANRWHLDPYNLDRVRAALLPVDILADTTSPTGSSGVETRLRDIVRPERIHDGAFVVAGWGNEAWRTRVHVVDEVVTVEPQPKVQREAPLAQWLDNAYRLMAETLPNAIDASTRESLAHGILGPPLRFAESQNRLLGLLVGAHHTLRRCARRVLLQTVAEIELERPTRPRDSAVWHVLARLVRAPVVRLSGSASHAVLVHDASPQCPTARRLRNL